MKAVYVKTKWVDNKTPVNAANLNKIEDGISTLFSRCLEYSDIKEGKGISVTITKEKEVKISCSKEVMQSRNIHGWEFRFEPEPYCDCDCCEEKDEFENGVMYMILSRESKKLKYILFNGVKIFENE